MEGDQSRQRVPATLRQVDKLRDQAQKSVAQAHRELRLAKCSAYRMAIDAITMRRDHADELRQKIAPLTFEQWVERDFKPLRKLGGNPLALIQHVENGMTLEDYLARDTA
jgi:hypothetical protein